MEDPFTPRTPVSPELLDAYAKGNLPPDQQHEVELLLEESPLHRDAVEGLRAVPGASLTDIDMLRPNTGGSHAAWWIGGGLLAVAGLVTWAFVGTSSQSDDPEKQLVPAEQTNAPAIPYAFDTNRVISSAELAAAKELPESLRIGHEPVAERPPLPTTTTVRDNPAEPLEPRTIEPKSTADHDREQQPKNAPRASRRLVFLHGLKVVHPDELYPQRRPMFFQTGVPANKPSSEAAHLSISTDGPTQPTVDTAAWNKLLRDSAPKVSYLDYLDHALAAFSNGDHRTALEELRYLLTQFPEDVNALFYCGLCCYNLGLTAKAGGWFMRAHDHKVDSFSEEASWYRALCIEKLYGATAAAKEFRRIAAQGGFYAEQAEEKLK